MPGEHTTIMSQRSAAGASPGPFSEVDDVWMGQEESCCAQPMPLGVLMRPATLVWGPSAVAHVAKHSGKGLGWCFICRWAMANIKLTHIVHHPPRNLATKLIGMNMKCILLLISFSEDYIQRPFLRSFTELNCYS